MSRSASHPFGSGPPSQLSSSWPLRTYCEMRSHPARRKLLAATPTVFHPWPRQSSTLNLQGPRRRSTSPEAAGRFAHLVELRRAIWRSAKSAPQPPMACSSARQSPKCVCIWLAVSRAPATPTAQHSRPGGRPRLTLRVPPPRRRDRRLPAASGMVNCARIWLAGVRHRSASRTAFAAPVGVRAGLSGSSPAGPGAQSLPAASPIL